ncbi:Protein notum-like protein, partial [Harpegnathos saltator]
IALCLVVILTTVAEDTPTNTVWFPSDSPPLQSNAIQRLLRLLGKYGSDDPRSLKRVYLSNRSITCNDGSQAGFYLRKSQSSKQWIVYLEGGWYCYDHTSCRNRWLRLRHLMTSTQWPDTRDVGGLLSPNEDENPFWHNANHVFVPYCTSDSWSGTRATPEGMFSFMGAEVLVQVVRDLIPLGLEGARSLLLAGSSAGGTGVMLNLNRIHNLVHHELGLKHVDVRGVSDSGWFLDRVPYSPNGLASIGAIHKGMDLWKSRIPHNCVAKYRTEPWRCFFGYRLYPTLTAPLFVFQWLFDEAQMSVDNVGSPVTKQQWDYIHKMGDSMRRTLTNVTAVFAPSCISHSVLTKKDWNMVKIDDVSLPQALHCWEQMPIGNQRNNTTRSQIETNQPCAKSLRKLLRSGATKGNGTSVESRRNHAKSSTKTQKARSAVAGKTQKRKTASDSIQEQENENGRRGKNKGKRRERNRGERRMKKEKHERRKAAGHSFVDPCQIQCQYDSNDQMKIFSGRRKAERGKQNNGNNHTAMFNGTRPQRSVIPSGKRKCVQGCHFRLIEHCTWPQCNHRCPKLHNPYTGEEMDFIELLKSFGLDMKSVANALGIDIHTLNSMDHEELLNLLTQRAN